MANAWIVIFLSGSADSEVSHTEVLRVEGMMNPHRCDLASALENGGP